MLLHHQITSISLRQQASMKPEVCPGKCGRARSGARLRLRVDGDIPTHALSVRPHKDYTPKLSVSLSDSVPSLLSVGSCSKCLALGTFTSSPKLNHSPSCTFSCSTHQIPLISSTSVHSSTSNIGLLFVFFRSPSASLNTAINKSRYLICNVV